MPVLYSFRGILVRGKLLITHSLTRIKVGLSLLKQSRNLVQIL